MVSTAGTSWSERSDAGTLYSTTTRQKVGSLAVARPWSTRSLPPDEYRVPLANFQWFDRDVGLQRIRDVANDLYLIRDRYAALYDAPMHLPFQFTSNQANVKMMSNYFERFPRDN